MDKLTQKQEQLEGQIERLRAEKKILYEEMTARGEEISRMIRIFLSVRNQLPAGPLEQIERIARQYALRNDTGRGSVPKHLFGKIDIRSDGLQGINKAKAERFNDRRYKDPFVK